MGAEAVHPPANAAPSPAVGVARYTLSSGEHSLEPPGPWRAWWITQAHRNRSRKAPVMKLLFWAVLAIALAANVSTSFAFDGVTQILVSVGTGVVVLGSAAGLYALRDKHAG